MRTAFVVLAGVLTSALAFGAPNPAYVPREAEAVIVLDHLDQPAPKLDVLSRHLEQEIEKFKTSTDVNSLSCGELILDLLGYHTENGRPCLKAKSITASWVTTEREKDFDVFFVVEQPAMEFATFVEGLKKALAEQPADAPKPLSLEEQGDWWVLREPVDPGCVEEIIAFRAIPDGLFFAYSTDEAFVKQVGNGEVPSIVGSESPLLEAFAPPPQEAVGPVFRLKSMQPGPLEIGNPAFSALIVKLQTFSSLVYLTESNLASSVAFQMADEAAAQALSELLITAKVMVRVAIRSNDDLAPETPILSLVSAILCSFEGTQAQLRFNPPLSDLEKAVLEFENISKKDTQPDTQD